MSEPVADVFRKFDLGNGYLHPVEILHKDGNQSFRQYYILVAGNEKKAFSPKHSAKVIEIAPGWYNLPPVPKDDTIVMNPVAQIGPDVWHQWGVRGLYLSAVLKEALEAAKFHKLFHLYRVPIVRN